MTYSNFFITIKLVKFTNEIKGEHMKYKGSNQSTIKYRNKKLIFNVLLTDGAMTRANIAKVTGISKPSVSKNVDELISDGIVIESGKDNNSIGKKGTILQVNKDICNLLVIDLSKNKLNIFVTNIVMDTLYEKKISLSDIEKIDCFLNEFKEEISAFKIGLVSISYPGVVKDGEIKHSKKSIKSLYENKILPLISFVHKDKIFIKNDLNNSVIAESEHGFCKYDKNAVLISCDNGVGAGIIINNMIYEGDRFGAGEIGYINSTADDDEFMFLENKLSSNAIAKRYSKITAKQVSYEDFKQDLIKNKSEAISFLEVIVKELVATIVTVLSVLDIHKCGVTGKLFDLTDDFVQVLQREINVVAPFEIQLKKSELKNSSIEGAMLTGLNEFYKTIKF